MTITTMEDLGQVEVGKSIEDVNTRRVWTRTENGFTYDGAEVSTALFSPLVKAGQIRGYDFGGPVTGDVFVHGRYHYLIAFADEAVCRYIQFRDNVFRIADERPLSRMQAMGWTRLRPDEYPAWTSMALALAQLMESIREQVRVQADLLASMQKDLNEAREQAATARRTTAKVEALVQMEFPLESTGGCVCDQVTERMVARVLRLQSYSALSFNVTGCGRH